MIYFMMMRNFTGKMNWEHCSNNWKHLLQKLTKYVSSNPCYCRFFFKWYGVWLFRKEKQRQLDVISDIFSILTFIEPNLWTTYSELIGLLYSLTMFQFLMFWMIRKKFPWSPRKRPSLKNIIVQKRIQSNLKNLVKIKQDENIFLELTCWDVL